jgi:hypothetical protein
LADLAESQWGLFTSAQVAELGFTPQRLKRLADAELITRIRQGVYRLTGTPTTPQDRLRAEWLALEPDRLAGDRRGDAVIVGVVSHRSAALLQDLGDIDADRHEFTVPKRRGTRSRDVKFYVQVLSPEDWYLVGGLPVTRPLRTVVDLAAARIDGGHLASIVRDAILSGDTTREEIATVLRPYAHHYGFAIGAGEEMVRTFIGQAGIPDSAKALTRDALADLVLLSDQANRILVDFKHTRRVDPDTRQYLERLQRFAQDHDELVVANPRWFDVMREGFTQRGMSALQGSDRSAFNRLLTAISDQQEPDDSDTEVHQRPRLPYSDQHTDRKASP